MPLTVRVLYHSKLAHWLWIKILGGKEARLGSWGPGRGPSWEEYRSGGTGGSHPGIKVPDLPPGVRLISRSHGGLRETGGGAPPGGSTDQVVLGVATLEWIFLRTCLQWARALLWGKVQLMGALPCHHSLLTKNKSQGKYNVAIDCTLNSHVGGLSLFFYNR